MEEVTINLLDLIHRILLRWRLILIWLIIGAVLGNCVGYLRALRNYQKEQDTRAQAENEADDSSSFVESSTVDAGDYDLTDHQIISVQSAADAYLMMQRNYNVGLTYYQSSVKMQLDPNSVPTVTLQYFVDTHLEAEYPTISKQDVTSDILASFGAKITGEDVCQKIEEDLSWDVDAAYVQELISVDAGSGYNEEQGIDTSSKDLLTVQVIAPEKEDCLAISTCIKDAVKSESRELKDVYGDFDITLIQEQYFKKADPDLLYYQQDQFKNLDNLRSSMSALANNMTSDEEEYYEALISDQLSQDEELMEEEAGTEMVSSAPSPIRSRFLLLGAFLGVVIACGYLFLRYILAKNLRIKDDLEETYHMSLLGTIETEKKQPKFLGFIDRWIDSWFAGKGNHYTNEERLEMICAGIRIAVEKAQMKSVYLTGTSNDDVSRVLMQQMMDKLSGSIGISSGNSVVYDPASLEEMTSSDGVIFIERVDCSPYEDLQKETELCKMYDTSIIGSVVIE